MWVGVFVSFNLAAQVVWRNDLSVEFSVCGVVFQSGTSGWGLGSYDIEKEEREVDTAFIRFGQACPSNEQRGHNSLSEPTRYPKDQKHDEK